MAGTGIIERSTSLLRALWPIAVLVRVAVALALIVGPATDEPTELAGWDAERFQEIAERDGPAWLDHPVEYPPGSVVVFDRLAGADVVDTHRRLVGLSLVLDLGLALAIAHWGHRRAGELYLLLGLPLVPFGYQRLDTMVTAMAAAAALVLLAGRSTGSADPGERSSYDRWSGRHGWPSVHGPAGDGVAAVAIAAGTMIKVWPLLLVVGAIAIGRLRAAAAAIVLTGAAGVAWLLATGAGLEPVDQVLSLRGATGWHVESLPGSLVALTGSATAELELDAYRIGTLRPGLVTAGRGLALVVMGLLALVGWRRHRGRHRPDERDRFGATSSDRVIFSLAVLGAVAALMVTAPLLSPQFLVWLTPWAALAAAPPDEAIPLDDGDRVPGARPAMALTFGAAVLTGVALHGFGPAGLSATAPAALLTARNLILVALPVACLAALRAGRATGP